MNKIICAIEQDDTFLDENLNKSLTANERRLLELALYVFRSGHEHADYLHWWLHTYGLSPEPSADLLSDWLPPSSEGELNSLEAKFDHFAANLLKGR